MKNAFFPGNTAWNEHSKWLELFTTPVSIESNAQNFSNFGSKNESYSNDVGVDSIIDKICEKLAIDVFHEIRNDVKPNQRSAYTAHCERQKCKPINGNQAAKISKNNHNFAIKGRTAPMKNFESVFAKSRLANLS